MTKVLLVSPPFYRLQSSHYNGINLGLAYLSAILIETGIDCHIYNADFMPGHNYADQLELYNHYGDYKKTIGNPNHPIWHECVDTILSYHPDWVGFSMFTANLPTVALLARRIKQCSPNIRSVVGGPHVTLSCESVLSSAPAFDFAIRGEGEKSLPRLIKGEAFNHINGLIYRDGGRIIVNPETRFIMDLDQLPFPVRNRFFPQGQQIETHYVITSRGCPNQCAFCASPVIWKRKVRFRSVDNIMAELDFMAEEGYRRIQFQDDTFTFRKRQVMALMRRMREARFGFTWTCDTRLNCLDEKILEAMKAAGCVRVKVGVESGNPEILRLINKDITPELVMEKTALIKSLGMSLTAYFMIGFPGETDAQAMDTIALAKGLDADYYSLSVVAPYYGTKLYRNFMDDNGYRNLKNHWEYFFHHSRDMILTSKISPGIIDQFWGLHKMAKGKRI